jgi:predicted esterase
MVVTACALAVAFGLTGVPAGAQLIFEGGAPKTPADATSKPKFTPGSEAHVLDSNVGGLGYFAIYTPKDYKNDHPWPVIFYYHDTSQGPQTTLFQQATNWEGYIIVGLEYCDRGADAAAKSAADLKLLKEFYIPYVSKNFAVDRSQFILAGFGKGGAYASQVSGAMMEAFAGVVILGSGMNGTVANTTAIKGKPVFIGVGEKDDDNLPAAKSAVDFYTKQGASVVYEVFKGAGHSADGQNGKLRKFLAGDPSKTIKTDLAAAATAMQAGKLGVAYTLLAKVGGVDKDRQECKDAAAKAKAIGDQATSALSQANSVNNDGKKAEAIALLKAVVEKFEGSSFADQARTQLKVLAPTLVLTPPAAAPTPVATPTPTPAATPTPAPAAPVDPAKFEAAATALEAQAKAAEDAKDYDRAVKLYEQYVATYAKAANFKTVKEHLDALKADPAVAAAVAKKTAERECAEQMVLVEGLIANKAIERAREVLKQIIEKYPDTTWSAQAKERLNDIAH